MRNSCLVISVFALGLVTQVAFALDQPTIDQLTERLSSLMPPYWSVSSTTVIASVNAGDAVDPKIKQRFEAKVAPSDPLFVKDPGPADALAPYIPIMPSVATKETRTLYGVAHATYTAGDWDIEINLENNVADLGQPKSMFAGPTLVRGSHREKEVRSILSTDLVQQIQHKARAKAHEKEAHLTEELQAAKSKHSKALAELNSEFTASKHELEQKQEELAARRQAFKTKAQTFQNRINTREAAHADQMRQLEAEHAKALDGLQAKLSAKERSQAQKLAKLKTQTQYKLARVRERQQKKLDALKAANQTEIERAEQTYVAGVDQLKAEQKRKLAGLAQKNEQSIEKIQAEYKNKANALRERIKQTGKLVALQNQRNRKEADLAASRQKMLDKRTQRNQQFLASFRKKISSDEKDLRKSAFANALKSDNALLRRTALQVALAGDDPIMGKTALEISLKSDEKDFRRSAIEAGLNSAQQEVRREATKAGLQSDNADLRARALSAALGSDDRSLQHTALVKFVSNTSALIGTYTDGDATDSVTIRIMGFDPESGAVKAKILGWNRCERYPLTGNVTGTKITMANKYDCSVHYSIKDSGTLTGMLKDDDRNHYSSEATIGS